MNRMEVVVNKVDKSPNSPNDRYLQ